MNRTQDTTAVKGMKQQGKMALQFLRALVFCFSGIASVDAQKSETQLTVPQSNSSVQVISPAAKPHSISNPNTQSLLPIAVGAENTASYLPLLKGKRVGIVANPTSTIGNTHLVDTLKKLGIKIVCVFAPEHGFRGDAENGAHIENGLDQKTGLSVISLYGNHVKPTAAEMKLLDVMLFDIQDVGARFYTYLSTLHFVMQACSEQKKPLIVLDRPNPNGYYVAGPV